MSALLLCLISPSVFAMTERDAANNLLFFVAAMNEGAFCNKLGFESLAKLESWQAKNQTILIRSMKTVEDFAVASGKVSRNDASSVSLGLWSRLQQRDATALAPTRTARTCSKYEESLAFYESKFIR